MNSFFVHTAFKTLSFFSGDSQIVYHCNHEVSLCKVKISAVKVHIEQIIYLLIRTIISIHEELEKSLLDSFKLLHRVFEHSAFEYFITRVLEFD